MADRPIQRLRQFFAELRRRNVYRVAVTYAVVGFVLIQVADLTFVRLGLPSWTVTFVIVMVATGFPLALVLAWAFERTPEGMRRTSDAESPEEASPEADTGTGYKVLVGLGLLAAAVAGGWYLTGGGGGGSHEITDRTVAVLPFEVSGSGAEAWGDGMVTMLSTGLDGAGGIRSIADRTVFAALEARASTDRGTSTEEAISVAREVGAEFAVVGSAVQLDQQLRLTAATFGTRSGERLGQVRVEGPADSVTALTNDLARQLLDGLLEQQTDRSSVDLSELTTSDLSALRAYLRGEVHFRGARYDSAIVDYRSAVAEDSSFALAFARLASSHGWQNELDRREKYLSRAYELSDGLPPRERGVVRAEYLRLHGQAPAAADTLRQLSRRFPDDPAPWYQLGEVLIHHGVPRGWPEAERALERAVELDPGFAPYHHHFVEMAFVLHRDSAMTARRIERHPEGGRRRGYRLAFDLVFSDSLQRQEAWARLDTASLPAPTSMVEWPLSHPVDAALANRVLRRLRDRDDVRDDARPFLLMRNELRQGHLQRAVELAQEGSLPDVQTACLLTVQMTMGVPVPDSIAARHLDPERLTETPTPARLLCSGLYLLETGREREFERVVGRLDTMVDTLPTGFIDPEHLLDELVGFRAWKAGELERAEDIWPSTPPLPIGSSIWRGDLYRELGRFEKAEGWYFTAWRNPVTHERLGQLYEEMGEPEKAAAAYRRFIEAWRDAEPELQPRAEDARERLEALTDGDPPANE